MGDSWLETNGSRTERNEAMSATRVERDPLGELPVPAEALWGIQTERARQNFPISNLRPHPAFVDAVIWIKKAAALTHKSTGRLDAKLADAIVRAADEGLTGRHREQFVGDPYQAGAGTSHNMNCNEVLANRANELLGAKRDRKSTRLNSSHTVISYAVFCLKKKKKKQKTRARTHKREQNDDNHK